MQTVSPQVKTEQEQALAALDHFLTLAGRGKTGGGCSGGERRAYALAVAAIENVTSLDCVAVGGYIEFLKCLEVDGSAFAELAS